MTPHALSFSCFLTLPLTLSPTPLFTSLLFSSPHWHYFFSFFFFFLIDRRAQGFSLFWVALVVKNPPADAADRRNVGSIPGSGRPPGGGHGNWQPTPIFLPGESPRGVGVWGATVHRVTESLTQLKLTTHCWSHSSSSEKDYFLTSSDHC